MTDGWRTRKSHRMGADPQGNNHVIRELEVLATATSLFPEREEALEINVINGQWFNQLCLGNEASTRPVHQEALGRWGTRRGHGSSATPSPYLAPCICHEGAHASCVFPRHLLPSILKRSWAATIEQVPDSELNDASPCDSTWRLHSRQNRTEGKPHNKQANRGGRGRKLRNQRRM